MEEQEKIVHPFWVMAWDTYYPERNNVRKTFLTYDEAELYADGLGRSLVYDNVQVFDMSGFIYGEREN